jgi:hypothetical protein
MSESADEGRDEVVQGKGDGSDSVRGGGVRYVEAPSVALSYGRDAAPGHSGGGLRETI